jgi:hypothetical protein
MPGRLEWEVLMARHPSFQVLVRPFICVLMLFISPLLKADDQPPPATQPAPAAAKIKVGIILVDPSQDQVFYRKMIGAAMKNLKDPEVELYALTTQQMTQENEVAALLKKEFDEQHRIDATDAANLRDLNVIVAYFAGAMQDEMIAPITESVEHGAGLLIQQTLHSEKVDTREQIQKLDCVDSGNWFCDEKPSFCRIVAPDHPLVQDLKQNYPDGNLQIDYVMGLKGELRGTPLLVSTSSADEDAKNDDLIASAKSGERFSPLYIGELGKGKVVACQWYSAGKAFRAATANKFHIHCVQWLAGRPVK